jgi:hydroxymethylglutaryl-CoA synthase
MQCYLEALAGAFSLCRELERPALASGDALSDRLERLLYHTPFPKMAMKAHRRLLELDWQAAPERWRTLEPRLEEAASASYARQVAPALAAAARVGNTYTASLYLCLAALLESEGRALAGRRIGLFSYGSGCCAEYFTGAVPATFDAGFDAGVAAQLADRTLVDVDTYERLLATAESGGDPPPDFRGDFAFCGIRRDRREYARGAAGTAQAVAS